MMPTWNTPKRRYPMTEKLSDFTEEFIIRRYTAIEGGYVNSKNDLGGETNHGITAALANTDHVKKGLVEKFGWNGMMRNLTKEMAYWVYKTEFWEKMKCAQLRAIHPLLADKVFDIGINAGRARVGRFVQEFVNVLNNEQKLYPDLKVDGDIGDVTIGRVNMFIQGRGRRGIVMLIGYLISAQEGHYVDISLARSKNEMFSFGWLQRAFDSRVEYQRVDGLWS